jgi:hypothetical protein
MFQPYDHLQGATLFLAKVTFLKTLTDITVTDLKKSLTEPSDTYNSTHYKG